MKCLKQPDMACPFYNIRASAHPMVAFSGFYESHELLPLGDARGIVRRIAMDMEMANKVGTCCIIAKLIVALADAWAILSE